MTSTAVAVAETYDPYAAYGHQASAVRPFITFKNGEYLFGADKEVIPLNTRLIADMAGLRIGWKRWGGKAVTEERLGLLSEGFKMPARHQLGDQEQSLWEKDEKLQPRDPWQLTNELTLMGLETGDEFIFATSGKGGIGAVGELCKAYGKFYRQKPGMAPVIELDRDHYQHKVYGKTYFPVLKLVDWIPEPGTAATESQASALPQASPATALPPPAAQAPAPAKAPEPVKPSRTRF